MKEVNKKSGNKGFTPLENCLPPACQTDRKVFYKAEGEVKSVRRRDSLTGFTLIELITAMSIFVIISIAMSSIFYHGLKVWKVCQNKSEMLIVGSLSIDNLVNEIHEISLLNNIRLQGTANELYAVDLEADLETEKTVFRLFIDEKEGGTVLKKERLVSGEHKAEEFFSADELNISYFYDVDGEIQESLESSADGELCAVAIGINLTNNRYGVENKLKVDRFVRIASRNR